MGLIIGVAAGVALSDPIGQAYESAKWHASHKSLTGKPDCHDPGWYREIAEVDASAFHEYREKGDSTTIYTAGNTTDGDRRTAWVAPLTGNAEQDSISWDLSRPRHVVLMCVRQGFTRDYVTYAGNGRPKNASLTGCGKKVRKIHFPDRVDTKKKGYTKGFKPGDWFPIRVDCRSADLGLRITSAYPAYDHSHLVAVSDIKFYTG